MSLLPGPLGLAGGILSIIFPFLWPKKPEIDIQQIWKDFMEAVEQIAEKKVADYAHSKAIAELEGIRNVLELYQAAAKDFNAHSNEPASKERIRTAFRNANSIHFEWLDMRCHS
ncbi:insecticidal delta-endotoxin Cry8Ea1 family protein [Bacillus cereus]|uniref:insecticidal delta-endotoxin Cry8Ea1 family protein n=1 Tax=Bacillus cereus TaxID=1396 RepID=UPI000BEB5F1C|nr:insecticidal delta-endotoxin Cry8Ea1 family protein [Bacillus cereus]PEA01647.1 hypothetical protein CON37_26755 [Bacillus cereus]